MKELIKFFERRQTVSALLFFIIFWVVFFSHTGTLTSGYHFTDDHQILTINEDMNKMGFFETSKRLLLNDLNGRFRPFYYINRVTQSLLFKTNVFLWSFYSATLATLTFHFLFLFLYRQGFKFVHSLLFPFLCLIGTHSSIWWRLGPSESIAVFTFAVSLYFLSNSIFKRKKKHLFFSIVFLIFSSLSKESFFAVIPAYAMLLLFLNYNYDKGKSSFFKLIKTNLIPLSFLSLVFILEAIIILFVVGTNKTGYAGIDDSFILTHFIYWVYSHIIHSQYVYLILVGLFLLIQNFNFSTIDIKKQGRNILPFALHFTIVGLILFPQFLLYFKSGFCGRYLVPLNIGFGYSLIFVLDKVVREKSITIITKRVFFTIVLLVTCSWLFTEAIRKAKRHTQVGITTNILLKSITEQVQKTDSILLIVNSYENYELSSSLHTYLRIKNDINNISILIQNEEAIESLFNKTLHRDFKRKYKSTIVRDLSSDYPCIIVAPSSSNEKIIEKLNLNDNYNFNDFDPFFVYYKK